MIKDTAESYKHAVAKQLVCDWLRAGEMCESGYVETLGVRWRPNRTGPEKGVYVEFPSDCSSLVFDEQLHDWEKDRPWWARWFEEDPGRAPTGEEFKEITGAWPKFIVDVGVMHKGALGWAVEIVHTSFPTSQKWKFLEELVGGFVFVSAEKVLRRTSPPTDLLEIALHGSDLNKYFVVR